MKSTWSLLVAAVSAGVLASRSSATVFYDGPAGTTPPSQGWLAYAALPGTAIATTAGGKTTLDTTVGGSNLEHAGYSNYTPGSSLVNAGFPVLSSVTPGSDLQFTMKLDAEAHATNDRAGFSAILLDSNHKGIEIGFWSTEVWAQNDSPLFTHGEGNVLQGNAAYDPSAFHSYDLTINGGSYALQSDGHLLVSGTTRDYSAFGVPYTLGSYLFLGDDTGSARAIAEISNVAVVPEPMSAAAAILATLTVTIRTRRFVRR